MGDLIGFIAVAGGLAIPISAIWGHHVRKLAEIKASGVQSVDNALRNEVDALRAEVAALRDTTTKFDLSFDAQLTQLETRMERSEEKTLRTYGTAEAPQTQNVGR
jgi:hypothetical protein